jgi:hypothetical protein
MFLKKCITPKLSNNFIGTMDADESKLGMHYPNNGHTVSQVVVHLFLNILAEIGRGSYFHHQIGRDGDETDRHLFIR